MRCVSDWLAAFVSEFWVDVGLFSNKDEIAADSIGSASLVVFGCPRDRFTAAEVMEITLLFDISLPAID